MAPIFAIERHRFGSDGNGITTLVGFHGCPLRCKYCLNPGTLDPDAKVRYMTAEELMSVLRRDELYFRATKGGVTFGGGEPLLNSEFIKQVMEIGANKWNVTVETSLNVPKRNLEMLLPYIDEYIVDVKDMNSETYRHYTGRDNTLVKSNLKWLISKGRASNIICRIPLIHDYNDLKAQESSKKSLCLLE